MVVKTIVEKAVIEDLGNVEETVTIDPNAVSEKQCNFINNLLKDRVGAEDLVMAAIQDAGVDAVHELHRKVASELIDDLMKLPYRPKTPQDAPKEAAKPQETKPTPEKAYKPTAEAKATLTKPQTGHIVEAQTRPNILPSGNMVKKTLAEAGKFSIIEWPDGGRQLRKHSYDPKTKEAKDYHIPLSSITDYLEAQCVLAQTSRVDVTVKK